MEGFKSFTAKQEGSILQKVNALGTPNNKTKQHQNQENIKITCFVSGQCNHGIIIMRRKKKKIYFRYWGQISVLSWRLKQNFVEWDAQPAFNHGGRQWNSASLFKKFLLTATALKRTLGQTGFRPEDKLTHILNAQCLQFNCSAGTLWQWTSRCRRELDHMKIRRFATSLTLFNIKLIKKI